MGVFQPQGDLSGNDRDADVVSPRLLLRAMKDMLSVKGVLRLHVRGLVSCFFPRKTARDIDIWIGVAVESWRDVHNRYRDRFLAEPQVKEETDDDACVGYCKAVDPTLVSDESAIVVSRAPQLMWNYMRALMKHLCPAIFADVLTMEMAYRKATETLRRFTQIGHSNFLSAISDELPMGKQYGGTVLDLAINSHRWCEHHYLYSCVLGLDGDAHGLEGALAPIDMLLYRLASEITQDREFIAACEASLAHGSVILRTVWASHKVMVDKETRVNDVTIFVQGSELIITLSLRLLIPAAASDMFTTRRIGMRVSISKMPATPYLPEQWWLQWSHL